LKLLARMFCGFDRFEIGVLPDETFVSTIRYHVSAFDIDANSVSRAGFVKAVPSTSVFIAGGRSILHMQFVKDVGFISVVNAQMLRKWGAISVRGFSKLTMFDAPAFCFVYVAIEVTEDDFLGVVDKKKSFFAVIILYDVEAVNSTRNPGGVPKKSIKFEGRVFIRRIIESGKGSGFRVLL